MRGAVGRERGASATDDGSALVATLIRVALVSARVWVGFAVFGSWFARLSRTTTAMLARIGGLLLATIGLQLALGGIRTFYGF